MSDDIRPKKLVKIMDVVHNSLSSIVKFQSSFAACTGFLCWFAPNSEHDQAYTLILPMHLLQSLSSFDTEFEKYNFTINDSKVGTRAVKKELFQRIWSDDELDIIVLHLRDKVTMEWLRLGAKFLEADDVEIGTTVIALEHPLGMDIHTSMGKIKEIKDELAIHTAGTAPGSSGCPILNLDQFVVAVHRGQYISSNNEKIAICVTKIEKKFFDRNSGNH